MKFEIFNRIFYPINIVQIALAMSAHQSTYKSNISIAEVLVAS